MSCIQFDFSITNDKGDKLRKSVERVAGTDSVKAVVLASYFENPDFISYFEKETGTTDFISVNGNTIYSLLNKFFKGEVVRVENDINKRTIDSLNGFTSNRAKAIAKDHTANVLLDIYYNELNKPKEQRLNRNQIIKKTSSTIVNNFTKNYANVLLEELYAKEPKKFESIRNDIHNNVAERNKLNGEYKQTLIEYRNTSNVELKDKLSELSSKINDLDNNRLLLFSNLVDEYGNDRQKNYKNLVIKAKGDINNWYIEAFTIPKLFSINREFNKVLEVDKLDDNGDFNDDNDFFVDGGETDNAESKRWAYSMGEYSNYTKHVSADLKVYFNTLYHLSEPNFKDTIYNYDTNNELGVPMTMGADYIINQLSNLNFASVDAFMNDLESKIQSIPAWYGLSKLIYDMRNDAIFRNKVFVQLANPKIKKAMILVNGENIILDQSNKSLETTTTMLYELLNITKNTIPERFNVTHATKISDALAIFERDKNDSLFISSSKIKKVEEVIKEIMNIYFPNINNDDIINYLYISTNGTIDRFKTLLNDLYSFTQNAEKIIDNRNEVLSEQSKRYSAWKRKKREFEEAGFIHNEPAPPYDISGIDYSYINEPLINITKKISNYMAIKNELNSMNAEGNLSSDLIGNNYITNTLKQIQFGTPEDANAGLQHLLDFISKSPQYDYSNIFYGIKDKTGKIVTPGLFIKQSSGKTIIHPRAKELIDIYLFSGISDQSNSKNALYSSMSAGDYFITNLVAFHSPVKQIRGKNDKEFDTAGFFMKTPSDASKNHIVNAPVSHIWGLFRNDVQSERDYVNNIINNIYNNNKIVNNAEFDIQDAISNTKFKNNKITSAIELFNIINDVPDYKNVNKYQEITTEEEQKRGLIRVPLIYQKGEESMVVVLNGVRAVGTSNKIMTDITIEQIYTNVTNANNDTILSNEFIIAIRDEIVKRGVESNNIKRHINKSHPLFVGFYNNIYGELNNFINNLNNIIEYSNGEFVIKKNYDNLIDRYHFNDGEIVKDGKLTGNVFKFLRLFNTGDIDINNRINNEFLLYGQGIKNGQSPIITITNAGNIKVAENRDDLIIIDNNKISLNISKENVALLENMVSDWMFSFSNTINNESRKYQTIIGDIYNNEQVQDAMFNIALMQMNFDDLFDGDFKFYKDELDFFKRVKETQGAGKTYAGTNVNDSIGTIIKDIVNTNGEVNTITVNGQIINLPRKGSTSIIDGQLNQRNGFRGITIKNTIRPSDNANNIYNELVDILKTTLPEDIAINRAKEIAKGYGFDSNISTKVNDAQSYITLEEFIARKYADGTLNEYEPLLKQLMDDTPINEIDIKSLNSLIQVQKNFYYDKQFDEITGTYYPRQIKNAEFVLIPKFIKGTSLEKLYNIMKKYDIGQVNTVETSKAAKRDILTFWDNNGVASDENIAIFEEALSSDIPVENYYYRFLYKQQDMVDHMKDKHNKAGIQLMKKILDNASTGTDYTRAQIKNIFDNYSANIKEDFNTLMDNMGWKFDNEGRIINKNDKGETLDFTEFYKRAREEAARLGMDSNFMDYFKQDINGRPVMPNYMNNVSSKIESIAQALFNSSVTRQTLPGWHAAQVTNVGYDNTLKYHPAIKDDNGNIIQEAYAEVKLPRWSNLIPKDITPDQLKDRLDLHLGYRIPTEGKQSISILKVVEFLDDAYGSTIVVPDEWVTQTGSDFDIDSIYGISYEIYKDRYGDIRKIQFDDNTDDEYINKRYIRYVLSKLNDRIEKNLITDDFIKDNISDLVNDIRDVRSRRNYSKEFKELMDIERSIFVTLPEDKKIEIKNLNINLSNVQFSEKLNTIANIFEIHSENERDNNIKNIYKQYVDINRAIADLINVSTEKNNNDVLKLKSDIKDKIVSLYKQADLDYLNRVEEAAVKSGIISRDEFAELPIEEQNSRRARNNKILDAMIEIMKDSTSREENYSRSNFDDLFEAKQKYDNLNEEINNNFSPYNPFTQIDFMSRATSGMSLKAFSVTRDTFNSINNYTQSLLGKGHEIKIAYPKDKYNIDIIKDAYDLVEDDTNNNTIIVTHNKLANSKNNRNVIGKLLTPYSSQTTAHILDVIKEGSIFNENEYTFGTFKTLLDVGSDYNTAVGFLQQPAVTRIVDAYYETKSLYINGGNNPIDLAIKRIAAELGIFVNGKPVNDFTNITKVLNALFADTQIKNSINKLFKAEIKDSNSNLTPLYTINSKLLENRFKYSKTYNNFTKEQETVKYDVAVHDIATILTFKKINETTKNLENIARVSNPDKFGAKQTIRATRKILDNINEYLNEESNVYNTLLVKDKQFLESLYPVNSINKQIDISKSSYPFLASFLQHSTIPSIQINSQLFPMEGNNFAEAISYVENYYGTKFTDEQYREFKQYTMSNIYNSIPQMSTPYTINEYGWFVPDDNKIKYNIENSTDYWDVERARIYGYDTTESTNLKIQDINEPTQEELDRFNNLTPMQKVIWIQTNFKDGKGVFEYLKTNSYNPNEYNKKGFTTQRIYYYDQIDNIEDLYSAYRESFFNKNPIIRLAALDLMKYAFVVEGFKFKKGAISRIITNDSLIANVENKGVAVLDSIDKTFNLYIGGNEVISSKYMDKFIRSHSEIVKEYTIPKPNKLKNGDENIGNKFNKIYKEHSMFHIPFIEEFNELFDFMKISTDYPKNYIRLTTYKANKQKETTLYKIVVGENGLYFYPMNLLERNETYNYSANFNNNKYKDSKFYESIIGYAEQDGLSIKEIVNSDSYKWFFGDTSKYIIPRHKPNRINEATTNEYQLINTISKGTKLESNNTSNFINAINDVFQLPVEERGMRVIVHNDSYLINSLFGDGISYRQVIPFGEDNRLVEIKKVKPSKTLYGLINNNVGAKINKLPIHERYAYNQLKDSKSVSPKLYEVTIITDEQVKKEYEEYEQESNKERNIDNEAYAITSLIDEVELSSNTVHDDIDSVAKAIFNELDRRKNIHQDRNAEHFIRTMNLNKVDRFSSKSIHDSRANIFRSAANYYIKQAQILSDKINNFVTITGNTYSIDDNNFYNYLSEHPEDYPILLNLVLEAKTFGQQFEGIIDLNLVGEDIETTKAINDIRESIFSIRNNNKVKIAIDSIFNKYLANNYSTNPLVQHGLINVTTAFGDSNWFDLNFSDIGELNNKQVQLVYKYVTAILNDETSLKANQAVIDFRNRYNEILSGQGSYNVDNIITKEGKFVSLYTDKFLEDREKVVTNLANAKEQYGEDSIEFVKAKLARDKFMAKNVHQQVVQEYYNNKNEIVEKVINNAGDLYVEYMSLVHELYNDNKASVLSIREEKLRKKEINRKISNLLSEYTVNGDMKDDKTIFKIGHIKAYVEANKALNAKYFDYNETQGFSDAVKKYTDYINRYNNKYPLQTLEEKLSDKKYREAYDWINANTIYVLDNDSREIITKAFATLKDNYNINKDQVGNILRKADAYDDKGNIDPTKLSEEDLKRIKEITAHKYHWYYESNAGEAILIKEIPSDLPVLKDSFYRLLRDESENSKEVNPFRLTIIRNINDLLRKAVDGRTGQIRSKDLFEKLTEDELVELGNLYQSLHNIKGKRKSKELKNKFKDNVSFEVNNEAFNRELLYAKQHLNNRMLEVWNRIFIQTDKDGIIQLDDDNNFIPNNDLFGYIMPKDDTYVDIEKTKARKIISNNVEFNETEYYYQAAKKATEEGKFNEWYNNNHVYNPYKHRMEPLRVWTEMNVIPGDEIKANYDYVPTFENTEKHVKDEYRNPNHKTSYSKNYNDVTGEYNNITNLTDKEKEMLYFLQSIITANAKTYNMKAFAERGFLPRRYKQPTDGRWFAEQVFGAAGLEFRNTGENSYTEKIDFVNDREVEFDMMRLIKAKGYKDLLERPVRDKYDTDESYAKKLKEVQEQNRQIEEENLKIDNAYLDRDWENVFEDFIKNVYDYNARQKVKNTIYLLIEDLKERKALELSRRTGTVRENRSLSTNEHIDYKTRSLDNTLKLSQVWARRIINNEFKKESKLKDFAGLMQNITSAKYMIFNVSGGIANVLTGGNNILGEILAKDYFDDKTFLEAQSKYISNSLTMIADMYSPTTNNLTVALTKLFNVVDFDNITERRPNEKATEYVKRWRDSLYGLQSGGEHYMQNVSMLALLKSHRVYKDSDGVTRIGSFANYSWDIEIRTLMSLLSNNEDMLLQYKLFIKSVKDDMKEFKKYDTFNKDFNEEFLRTFGNKDLINKYIIARKEALNKAKEEFNKFETAEEQFELRDGIAVIKENSGITGEEFGSLQEKARSINKKIHGVYDKRGAAKIEEEWWGGLIMQYHKHLYPGIMKRYRTKGYYNEVRHSVEKGSYMSFINLLSKEFVQLQNKNRRNKENGEITDNENKAIKSLQSILKASIDTIINIKMNYDLMPVWEQNNIRRSLADLFSITAAVLVAIGLHAITDEDELKDNNTLGLALYLADRFASESQMYYPWGMYGEAKTLWSSPIAALGAPGDLLKGMSIISHMLFDPDYDAYYKSGLYKGEHKLGMVVKRNIPILRVYERLGNMSKSNQYYRLNENALNFIPVKAIADEINPD